MNQENIEAEKRKSSSGSSMAKQVNNREQKSKSNRESMGKSDE